MYVLGQKKTIGIYCDDNFASSSFVCSFVHIPVHFTWCRGMKCHLCLLNFCIFIHGQDYVYDLELVAPPKTSTCLYMDKFMCMILSLSLLQR